MKKALIYKIDCCVECDFYHFSELLLDKCKLTKCRILNNNEIHEKCPLKNIDDLPEDLKKHIVID